MLIGYVRVSTDDQNFNLQKDALIKYGVENHKFDIVHIIDRIDLSKSEIIN